MSTLAKTYALACGVPLSKPTIFEQFFPLDWPVDKIILLHAGGGQRDEKGQPLFSAKIYDHFDEVVRLITPQIEKAGYKIYQIGGPSESGVSGAVNLCGQTTVKQTAYLLNRCALFIGNDSMNAHIAGSMMIPMVVLYGPTDPKNHGPEWCDPAVTILIESHRFGAKRPSYASNEPIKTINAIPPEQVANAALGLLGLENVRRKSLFFGSIYRNQILEIIPDTQLRPEFFPNVGIAIRMDYFHNESGLIANLSQRKSSIFLDRPINLDIFKTFRSNVVFVRIKVTEHITPKFIKDIARIGIPFSCFTEEHDPVKLKKLRYDFFDVCLIDEARDNTAELFWEQADKYLNTKLDRNLNLSELTYCSNKYLISGKGIYLNKAAYDKNLSIPNLGENHQTIGELANSPDFWKEIQHYYIYKKE